MFPPIEFPSGHDVSWGMFIGDPILCGHRIQPQYSIFNQVDQHDSWDILVWEDLIGALHSVFHSTDIPLNFWFHRRRHSSAWDTMDAMAQTLDLLLWHPH